MRPNQAPGDAKSRTASKRSWRNAPATSPSSGHVWSPRTDGSRRLDSMPADKTDGEGSLSRHTRCTVYNIGARLSSVSAVTRNGRPRRPTRTAAPPEHDYKVTHARGAGRGVVRRAALAPSSRTQGCAAPCTYRHWYNFGHNRTPSDFLGIDTHHHAPHATATRPDQSTRPRDQTTPHAIAAGTRIAVLTSQPTRAALRARRLALGARSSVGYLIRFTARGIPIALQTTL